MARQEGPNPSGRCQRQRRRQRQGVGPDWVTDPRRPTCAWARSPNNKRQRQPRNGEPLGHPGPPAPCVSRTLGEEAARKRWHVRIGTAGARVVRVRNAQATGGFGHQRRANHGLRGATRPWHRFGRLPGTDSASQALRCPPDTAALSGGFPAGPHERPHLPTAPPDTWASGNYVSTSPPNACWIPATTRAMAASSLAATFSVTTARPLPSRRQWPTVFDPHRITNTSS